ncbi:Uncharacterised protein [Candidatus Bartonella washoeensis]|uniref:Uncharacterized protein n=1 Tax=Candidatus Bartonella washoeensis Sb944nv TaxID=1094563 RepID=J0Q2T4_9HYPH|nr:hypothetical protein MCQ_00907 [Bartonella washoeensis Sb944nv]SPU27506.1 Uncharacterised protein [Bartonella washoeensis]
MIIDNEIYTQTITKQPTSPLLQSIFSAHTQSHDVKSKKIKPENDIFKTKVKKLSNLPYHINHST